MGGKISAIAGQQADSRVFGKSSEAQPCPSFNSTPHRVLTLNLPKMRKFVD
tara:strand:- start:4811 stop:4963 length:153 start_codon:yes stop_codon:yes gene_type:complete